MNSRSLLLLAVVIVIGVEKLRYSLAFERTGEFEFPFSIPFKDTFGVIQRLFPIQTKYISEILPTKPVLQQEEKPEADSISGNPSVKTQHEVPYPRADVANITSKAKNGRFRYRLKIKIKGPGGRTLRHVKTGYLTSSPDHVDEEDIESLLKNILESGNEVKCVPLGYAVSQNAEKGDEMQYPIQYRSSPNIRHSFQRMDHKGNLYQKERIIPLTRNNYLHNLKKAYQKHDEAEDNAKELKTIEASFSKQATEKPKLTEPRVHRYSPILRYSSQGMDDTGNLYRHERISSQPLTYRSYYLHKPMSTLLKQDSPDENDQEPIISKSSVPNKTTEKTITSASETTDDTFNEVLQEEPNKAMIWNGAKSVDTPVYPIKFKSFNFNIEPPVFSIDNKEDFDLKEYNAKSYGLMKTEVKHLKLEESEARSFKYKKSDSDIFDLKSGESKVPNFDENNTEDVKRVVIIQPQTKIFEDSVDIPSKESEAKMSDLNKFGKKNSESESAELKEPSFDEYDTEDAKKVVIQPQTKVIQESIDTPSKESEAQIADKKESGTKSSESKQPNFDEDDTEGVKRIVVIQPHIRVVQDSVDIPSKKSNAKRSDLNKSGTQISEPESAELKEPNFDEDDTEDVKKVVVIQPPIKVFNDSVALPRQDTFPIISNNDALPERSQYFRQLWAPLREILLSKVFGRPAGWAINP